MHAVLRNWCLSVDEPILGSTPALRHPWRACHTNPETLVDQRRCEHDLYRARLFLKVVNTVIICVVGLIAVLTKQETVPKSLS